MAKEQILKLYDAGRKRTVYIFYPENIYEIKDTPQGETPVGCEILYSQDDNIEIKVADVSARKMKRSIQEQLEGNHNIGFLKLHTNTNGIIRLQYINVKHIAGLIAFDKRCDIQMEYHDRIVRVEENPLEVAAQIRRVIKRLDQDQELCCTPAAAPAEDSA